MSTVLIVALLVIPAIFFWILFTQYLSCRYFKVPYSPSERHYAITEDGFHLALYRRKPKEIKYLQPIILCHGLGANRYNLDWPSHSLAEHMCELGFDVWVCELRGVGKSSRPKLFNGLSYKWNFDTHAKYDVPAIIDKVKQVTESKEVLWAGHSMGGMLMYAYLSRGGKDIKATFAIASPSTFGNEYSWARPLIDIGRMLGFLPVFRQEFFARLFAPVLGYTGKDKVKVMGNSANIDGAFSRRIFTNLISNLSWDLLLSSADWVENGRLVSSGGKIDYLESMKNIKTPFGFCAGTVDLLATPQSVEAAFNNCGSEDKTYKLFGKSEGSEVDYGHGDIVFAKSALTEIFPHVSRFFEDRADKV